MKTAGWNQMPWWACIALGLVGIEYARNASILDASYLDGASGDGDDGGDAAMRRLTLSAENASSLVPVPGAAPDVALGVVSDAVPMEFNVTVPCLSVLGFVELMRPCGNLTVPEDGITFTTLLGSYHLPGTKLLKKEVLGAERLLSQYTVLLVFVGLLIWVGSTLYISSRREELCKAVKDTLEGKLYDEEEDAEDPPTEQEKRARLDPLSNDFIAPGNIYRLLAVLHPGIVGVRSWGKHAAKALICAYMQLYLPYNVIKKVFIAWHFVGIKSPLWFVGHATTFASMVAALGSLCSMFAGKCAKSIRDGAEANVYILTHRAPASAPGANATGGLSSPRNGDPRTLDPSTLELRDLDPRNRESSPTTATALLEAPAPRIPQWVTHVNELFWCSLSMSLNIAMSLMLEAAMFLQVATFTGDIGDVAVTAVSLYFIFDLDDKVMEADPKLRLKYRRAVARQTEEKPRESRPFILPVVASTSAALVRLTVPFGLMGIVLFAWRNKHTGFVIGGDGLTM